VSLSIAITSELSQVTKFEFYLNCSHINYSWLQERIRMGD